VRTPIIPARQTFVNKRGAHDLNFKAICIFTSIGFFLEKDTYFNDQEVLQPAMDYDIDNNYLKSSKPYWQWHYNPRDISLKQATEEFAHLFEKITEEKLKNKDVILPLSGGLDSRTQAAALENNSEVKCYSYKFTNSFDETKYGKEICSIKKIPFYEYEISKGYLWGVIKKLAAINNCYADFTHPRQMAVIDEIKNLGNIFFLGHWGDVLFDGMGMHDDIRFDEQLDILLKKILKRGGLELSESLWEYWGLEGNFKEYLKERISILLSNIKIDNANSRIRAFKSMYWAPRWTSANMNVFSDFHPVVLPYYDDEMCKFICNIPETLLWGRQIQIEYIKIKNPRLAEIPWQNYEPFNLYNYKNSTSKTRIPARAIKKIKRILNEKIGGEKLITRNWEIQFKGEDNDRELKKYIFENENFSKLIPEQIVKNFYDKFRTEDESYYSHPLSILLTLSLFSKNILPKENV